MFIAESNRDFESQSLGKDSRLGLVGDKAWDRIVG